MLTICCLSLTLISLAISDLEQTSRFTRIPGHYEVNPITAPLVEGSGDKWEIAPVFKYLFNFFCVVA